MSINQVKGLRRRTREKKNIVGNYDFLARREDEHDKKSWKGRTVSLKR